MMARYALCILLSGCAGQISWGEGDPLVRSDGSTDDLTGLDLTGADLSSGSVPDFSIMPVDAAGTDSASANVDSATAPEDMTAVMNGYADAGRITDDSASALCVQLINQYRATLQLPPLDRWYDGELCASNETQIDGMLGIPHLSARQCGEDRQNECIGWPYAPGTMIGPCLQQMWNEGPGGGHYENMRASGIHKVACGFAYTKNGVWSVQNFK